MQIIWHGQSCFEIIVAKGKGESVTVLVDPPDEAKTGLKIPKINAQIILMTNAGYAAGSGDIKKNAPGAFIVDGPGEYEIKDIYIRGIDFNFGRSVPSKAAGTIYTIESEDMKLCHLGSFGESELSQPQVEKIGNIDILMFPLASAKADAKEPLKVMSQIEPSIVVPMSYKIPKLKIDSGDLEDFLKAVGVGSVEPQAKLVIKKKDIGAEEAKIIVLNP